MGSARTGAILQYLQRWAGSDIGPGVSDSELLHRFSMHSDERAFAALIRRHACLVWGVCRRILQHEQDAEDAFQATFLVLARRAGSIRQGHSVGSWLYGVAHRIALKAKKMAVKRRVRERRAAAPETVRPAPDLAWRELQALLAQELERLPEKYRAPFIACCLEGRSRKEAAAELGWKLGTVSSRIAQARRLLEKRLARRGVLLPAALTAGVLCGQTAAASVPALLNSTVKAASLLAAGRAVATGAVSTAVAALTEGMVKTMLFQRVKTIAACVVILSLLGVSGAAALSLHSEGSEAAVRAGNQPQAKEAKKEQSPPANEQKLSLPKKPAPAQGIASLDKDGNVVLRQVITFFEIQEEMGRRFPKAIGEVNVSVYDTKKIVATDTKGKRIGEANIRKRLGKDTAVLVTYGDGSEQVDPFHLLLIKDGTMILNLGSAHLKTLEGREEMVKTAPNQQKKGN